MLTLPPRADSLRAVFCWPQACDARLQIASWRRERLRRKSMLGRKNANPTKTPYRRRPWVSVSFLAPGDLGGSLGLARGLSSVRPGYAG